MTPQVKRAALARIAHKGIGWQLNVIVGETAEFFGFTSADILGRYRHARIGWSRNMAMYLSRTMTTVSYIELGAWFGRDHSTCVNAVDRFRRETRAYRQEVLLRLVRRRCRAAIAEATATPEQVTA